MTKKKIKIIKEIEPSLKEVKEEEEETLEEEVEPEEKFEDEESFQEFSGGGGEAVTPVLEATGQVQETEEPLEQELADVPSARREEEPQDYAVANMPDYGTSEEIKYEEAERQEQRERDREMGLVTSRFETEADTTPGIQTMKGWQEATVEPGMRRQEVQERDYIWKGREKSEEGLPFQQKKKRKLNI